MSFLPESYSVPQTGNYMKFLPGKNRLRILSSAIVGNEFWRSKGDSREPVRRRMNEPIAASELEWNAKDGAPEKVKHFWAFAVYNYASKSIQILQVNQKSIMQAVQALVDEPDWGDPSKYDLVITKTGNGLDTEYAVQPSPAKPLDPAIVEMYRSTPINLEALFSGGDPFSAAPTGGNGHAAAASPAAPVDGQAAMVRAMKGYKAKFPDGTPSDEIRQGWEHSVKKYFFGKDPRMVTATEWDKFAADKFDKPAPADPFGANEFTDGCDDPNSPNFIPF